MPKGKYNRPLKPVELPIGPSIAYLALTQGQFALIDRDDAAYLGSFNWCADWCAHTKSYYAQRLAGGVKIKLHRFLLWLSAWR